MMMFVILVVFVICILLGLKLSKRLSRTAFEITAILLLMGVVGYVFQGSPWLPGSPAMHATGAP